MFNSFYRLDTQNVHLKNLSHFLGLGEFELQDWLGKDGSNIDDSKGTRGWEQSLCMFLMVGGLPPYESISLTDQMV